MCSRVSECTTGRFEPETPTTVTDSFDLLSEVLQSARPRSWVVEEVNLASPWGFHFGGGSAAFYCVRQGHCWLGRKGDDPPVSLSVGDLALVMPCHDHSVRDRRDGPTVALDEVLGLGNGHVRRRAALGGDGPITRLTCGGFRFGGNRISPLLGSLPPLVVVRGRDGKAAPWLDETLRLMLRESESNRPGSQAVVDHLAQVIFIQAVRASFTTLADEGGRRLTAFTDADIAQALKLMHARLELPWTVAALAHRVCLSRSAFAVRFKALVSKSPLQYLMESRMQKACDLLADGQCGIKEIATRVGYATAAAFSNAFKRWSGTSPGVYRQLLLDSAAREGGGRISRGTQGIGPLTDNLRRPAFQPRASEGGV